MKYLVIIIAVLVVVVGVEAQQAQNTETPEVQQGRLNSVMLARNRSLESCYGTVADYGAELAKVQAQVRELEAKVKQLQDAAPKVDEEHKGEGVTR